jgi:hypothetical protein
LEFVGPQQYGVGAVIIIFFYLKHARVEPGKPAALILLKVRTTNFGAALAAAAIFNGLLNYVMVRALVRSG